MIGNFEANVLVDDAASTRRLIDYFDELFEGGRARRITEVWMEQYRKSWLKREKLYKAQRKQRQKIRSITAGASELPSPTRIRNKKFAFTGAIYEWPREKRLYPLIKRLGGLVAKRVNSMAEVDALVHGDILGGRNSTRKLQKARQRQIPIITEEEFFRAVKNEKRKRSH